MDIEKEFRDLIANLSAIPTKEQIVSVTKILEKEAVHSLGLITNRHSFGESDHWRIQKMKDGIALHTTALFLKRIFGIPHEKIG